jgi:hypothetical protein
MQGSTPLVRLADTTQSGQSNSEVQFVKLFVASWLGICVNLSQCAAIKATARRPVSRRRGSPTAWRSL